MITIQIAFEEQESKTKAAVQVVDATAPSDEEIAVVCRSIAVMQHFTGKNTPEELDQLLHGMALEIARTLVPVILETANEPKITEMGIMAISDLPDEIKQALSKLIK